MRLRKGTRSPQNREPFRALKDFSQEPDVRVLRVYYRNNILFLRPI